MRARKTVIAGIAAGVLCAAPTASFAYGPGGGGGGPTAPGFGPTISSTIVSSAGGDATGAFNKCRLHVVVPPKTFARPVNVVISKITNMSANKHLAKGHVSVCAFGVGFFREGKQIHVAMGRPSAHLHFTGSPIAKTDHLYLLVPGGSTAKKATFTDGSATSTLRKTRALAIVRSTS